MLWIVLGKTSGMRAGSGRGVAVPDERLERLVISSWERALYI